MTVLKGRIITNHGPAVAVETQDGTVLRGTARRKLGLVVCGDYVEYEMTGSDAVITRSKSAAPSLGAPTAAAALNHWQLISTACSLSPPTSQVSTST